MKSRILMLITAMTLFVALANPVPLYAQDDMASANSRTFRYRLIDIGTLGGPTTYESVNGPGNQLLNNGGIVSSMADTSAPDPRASTPNLCYNPDCFLTHAFRWKDGVLTDLGALPGVNSSAAGAINARGWSVGQSQNGEIDPLSGLPEIRAVLWADDQIIDLGTLGGNESLALYVNNAGQVIGAAANTTPDPFSFFGFGTQTRAFLWEKGVMRDLGTLGGPDAIGSFGGCVNERKGLIAGSSYTNSIPNSSTGLPTVDPFLWENGTMTDLGSLGGVYGTAQCANNRGQVIGQSSLAKNPGACSENPQGPGCHGFLWERGIMKDLGTLGGTFSAAIWLNNDGEAVGGATTPNDQQFHATLWRNRVITDLGVLPGDCFSVAEAINSKGQIVGTSFNCESNISRAVLWNKGSIIDLNTLVPATSTLHLIDAFNINNRGEILAQGLPPGVQSGEFGGHLALVIPCGNGNEGCKHIVDGTTAATPSSPAISVDTQITHMLRLPTITQTLDAWRDRMAQQYHTPGLGAPKE